MSDIVKRLRSRDAVEAKPHEIEQLTDEAADLIEQQAARIAELEAARIAYASEFEPDAEGLPDVGSIHANIRALKSKIEARAGEAVAVVESWTNGSYHRNYKLRWLKDVEAGTSLFTHPPTGDAAGVEIIRELQKALFYWMPSIAGEDSPAGQKAAEHASLLFGLDDSSTDCEGDRMMQSLRIRNQALERIELACRDAGCAEEMEFDEFIESLAGKDSVDAARYRWLQRQRSHVWHEFADVPINRTDELIDAAIASTTKPGEQT